MRLLKYSEFESIKVPIEIGDTIMGGRFKNKKTTVKKIGKDKNNQITVNDKKLLNFRIDKTMPKNENTEYDLFDIKQKLHNKYNINAFGVGGNGKELIIHKDNIYTHYYELDKNKYPENAKRAYTELQNFLEEEGLIRTKPYYVGNPNKLNGDIYEYPLLDDIKKYNL